MDPSTEWWRDAVIYQLYLRSYADGSGDGIGDLPGARARLSHLADLGVDAVWLNPWYVSPFVDGGYDVADYRSIDPVFGTLEDAEAFIDEALELGIRTIIEIVPNHVSIEHPWFVEALASPPGSPARDRFWFRPGRGDAGELPPTDWESEFHGGGTWTRVEEADGTPGDWYLHLFSPGQPDLNWDHADVRREHEEVLQFWFERGAAGARIDSAALAVKDPALPAVDPSAGPGAHPYIDRDDLHDIYRTWREIADTYDPPRILIGEVWLPDRDRFINYLRPDELHTAFNFNYLTAPWEATALRTVISDTLDDHRAVGAPPTWVIANHDVTRATTRYGREDSSFSFPAKRKGIPTDLELGGRRARAATLLSLALPGSFYLYQGEELGLPEVEPIPDERIQDPMYVQSGRVDPGRDGCRVPLPWHDESAPFGFSPCDATEAPWLPQPADWNHLTVQAQRADPGSTLSLHRRAIDLRRSFWNGDLLDWLVSNGGPVIAFRRGPSACVVNFGPDHIALPAGEIVLASDEVLDHRLAPDTTAWIDTTSDASDENSPPSPDPRTTTHHPEQPRQEQR